MWGWLIAIINVGGLNSENVVKYYMQRRIIKCERGHFHELYKAVNSVWK